MALNIQDSQPNTSGIQKKNTEKKLNKELFSQDEFKKLKSQVKRDKSVKIMRKGKIILTEITSKIIFFNKDTPKSKVKHKEKQLTMRNKMTRAAESKMTKKENTSVRVKKTKFERSNSMRRNKEFLNKAKEKKIQKSTLSKPKTCNDKKTDDINLDNIKNSIMRIKEKAFSSGIEGKFITKELSNTVDVDKNAYVSISSIDLGNAKDKKDNSVVAKAHSGLSKEITTFSLHQDENTIEFTESDTSNLTSKEPESHHPLSTKFSKGQTRIKKSSEIARKPK